MYPTGKITGKKFTNQADSLNNSNTRYPQTKKTFYIAMKGIR